MLIPTPHVLIPIPQVLIPIPQVLIPIPQVLIPIPQVLIPIPQVLIPIPQIYVVGIRLGHNVVIWPYYAHHVGHRLKILWGKSQATVPAPGKKGGRELAPVPGLPEGRYDCVGT